MAETLLQEVRRIWSPGYPTTWHERRTRLGVLAVQETAKRLPFPVRYWVVLQAGIGTMRPDEEVPAVPFTVVLERYGKPQSEWRS